MELELKLDEANRRRTAALDEVGVSWVLCARKGFVAVLLPRC